MSGLSNFCNKTIRYSFYGLFFLAPLVFWGSTSELFELNKMWLVYGLTIIIAAAWGTEMLAEKKLILKKTRLNLFLLLFLISQTLSTLFSFDSYISFWGYYSRFNGGLLSLLTYGLLYLAFVTHFDTASTLRSIKILLISGLIVALWGFPSHFGYDPTCYVFRGTFDTSCWTDAFKPTIRIFSTLGQPAWLAAFLAALLPVSLSFFLIRLKKKNISAAAFYLFLNILFYLCLLFTNTRAGFIGFWVANIIFWAIIWLTGYIDKKRLLLLFAAINALYFIGNFFFSTPLDQLNKFTLQSLTAPKQQNITETKPRTENPAVPLSEGISDSGKIRLYVWQGAFDAWKAYPLIGTGVETFAFAYYRYKPAAHNLTSEWDYLYNKAHNEYLNYLTTTGILGLGTYLAFLVMFVYLAGKQLYSWRFHQQEIHLQSTLLTAGLFTGWLSILITNFFGFSIVIMNILLLLIPAFLFTQKQEISAFAQTAEKSKRISVSRWLGITVIVAAAVIAFSALIRYWNADTEYNLGYNLARANDPQNAYLMINKALELRPNEPVYQDELSNTALQLGLALFEQHEATTAAELIRQSVEINNEVLLNHPHNVPFWKTRIRIFYTLGEIDPSYKLTALQAAQEAAKLAPTDIKILNNLGNLYAQTGDGAKAVEAFQKTLAMKPDYQDAYLSLAQVYHSLAVDKDGKIIHPDDQKKAVATVNTLLSINPQNTQARDLLKSWQEK